MRKHLVWAALSVAAGLLSVGAQNSYGLSAIAQGRPSITPTAPAGSALRTYQINCDPGAPQNYDVTFSYAAPTGFDGFLPVTDVEGVDPYVLNTDLIQGYINALNGDGHSVQIHGDAISQPTNPDPDIYFIQFDKGLLAEEVLRQELTVDEQKNTFFKFFAGGDGDQVTGFDQSRNGILQNELDVSIFDILNGPTAAPLPSAALGGFALLPFALLTRRRQPVAVTR